VVLLLFVPYFECGAQAGCVPLHTSILPAPCNITLANYHYAYFDSEEELLQRVAVVSQLALAIYAIPEPVCLQASLDYLCFDPYSGIPLCVEYEDDAGNHDAVDQPWTMCRSMCNGFNDACAAMFASIGFSQFIPDCALEPNATEIPVIKADGEVLTLSCLNGSDPVSVVPSECPPGMIINQQQAVCEFSCPSPVLTDSQISAANLMQQIVGWFSLVAAIVFIIMSAVIQTGRLYPHRLPVWLAVASVPLSLAFSLASFVGGVTNVWCDADSTLGFEVGDSTSSPLCTFQGWLIQFGSLAVASWWMCICVNLALLLTLGRARISGKIELVYHLLSWVIPASLSIGVAAAGKIQYEEGNSYCFISSESDNAIQIVAWFVWLGVYLLVGAISLIVCIVIVIKVRLSASASKRGASWSTYIRIVLFLVIFLYFYSVIFAQRIVEECDRQDLLLTESAYKLCLITSQQDCEQILDDAPNNWGLQMVSDFNLVSQGFFVAVLFITLTMLRWWFRRVTTCSGWTEPLLSTHASGVGTSPNSNSNNTSFGHDTL